MEHPEKIWSNTQHLNADICNSHLLGGRGQLDLDLGANEARLGHGEVQLLPGGLVDHAADLEVAGIEQLELRGEMLKLWIVQKYVDSRIIRQIQRTLLCPDVLKNSFISRVWIFNLGWRFLPSKVASDTKFLGRLWTDYAKNLGDF